METLEFLNPFGPAFAICDTKRRTCAFSRQRYADDSVTERNEKGGVCDDSLDEKFLSVPIDLRWFGLRARSRGSTSNRYGGCPKRCRRSAGIRPADCGGRSSGSRSLDPQLRRPSLDVSLRSVRALDDSWVGLLLRRLGREEKHPQYPDAMLHEHVGRDGSLGGSRVQHRFFRNGNRRWVLRRSDDPLSAQRCQNRRVL